MNAIHARMLAEMGIHPVWRLRSTADELAAGVPAAVVPAAGPAEPVAPRQAKSPAVVSHEAVVAAAPRAAPSGAQTDARANVSAILARALGSPAEAEPAPPSAGEADAPRIATLDWDALEAEIRACARCGLCRQRKQAVPGVGDLQADWMIVGEGPGAEEDRLGDPFVGPAGKLLDAMLAALGLNRHEKVYIANSVKCRPPGNRTPEPDEIATCLPFLRRQIELVQPRIILALGRPAAQSLLQQEIRIGPSRGKRFAYGDIPVVVSYHPAYLLRTPEDKAKAWEDLCFAQDLLAERAPS
ncbi:MAG: uracil-DNA glycosylase [Candidatus Dactylopiibacterium sp.]|nr:uracil-DNA glycosylase [Candidatus Dactylopiibacterium sp.]